MTFRVLTEPEAEREWNEAVDWYEERESGVGLRFNAAVRASLQIVAKQPERFPLYSQLTRKAKIEGWPYPIFFAVNDTHRQINVLPVWHAKRNPTTLRQRLK
jgi:plasmid stabilization system protein ParE